MFQDFSLRPQHSSSLLPFCPINLFSDINQHREISIRSFSPNWSVQCLLLISFPPYPRICHPDLFLGYILSMLAPTLPCHLSRTFCDHTTTKLFMFVVLTYFLFPQGALLSFAFLIIRVLCLLRKPLSSYCVCQGIVQVLLSLGSCFQPLPGSQL